MRLLLDMNLSPRWVEMLGHAGFAAVHWSSVGTPTASDIEITVFARVNDYVLLIHDLDFGAILAATGGRRPSVVQIRADNLRPDMLAGACRVRAQADDGRACRGCAGDDRSGPHAPAHAAAAVARLNITIRRPAALGCLRVPDTPRTPLANLFWDGQT